MTSGRRGPGDRREWRVVPASAGRRPARRGGPTRARRYGGGIMRLTVGPLPLRRVLAASRRRTRSGAPLPDCPALLVHPIGGTPAPTGHRASRPSAPAAGRRPHPTAGARPPQTGRRPVRPMRRTRGRAGRPSRARPARRPGSAGRRPGPGGRRHLHRRGDLGDPGGDAASVRGALRSELQLKIKNRSEPHLQPGRRRGRPGAVHQVRGGEGLVVRHLRHGKGSDVQSFTPGFERVLPGGLERQGHQPVQRRAGRRARTRRPANTRSSPGWAPSSASR